MYPLKYREGLHFAKAWTLGYNSGIIKKIGDMPGLFACQVF